MAPAAVVDLDTDALAPVILRVPMGLAERPGAGWGSRSDPVRDPALVTLRVKIPHRSAPVQDPSSEH